MPEKDETVSLSVAAKQVEVTSQRLALLHLAYARTIINELGEEKGKKLVLKAIKDYGERVGEQARRKVAALGLPTTPENYGKASDLPEYGMHRGKEKVVVDGEERTRAYGCVMGELWMEEGEAELGRLYCYVDAAKYMAYNPDFKLYHTKALPDGDGFCELCVRPTTDQEKRDFANPDGEWSYIDE